MNTTTVVFSISNLLHFTISIGAMFLMASNGATLVACMGYGATLVPVILGFHMIQKRFSSAWIVLYAILAVGGNFGAIVALNLLTAAYPDNLAFMAFIHGFIVPGNTIAVAELIKSPLLR